MNARFKLAVRAGLVAALLFAVDARAAVDDQEAPLTLFVNRVEQGEVIAILRGDDVLVSRADLEAANLHDFQATEVVVGKRKLISLASVRPAVTFRVDEEAIALRLDAPIAMLPSRHLDLGWGAPPDLTRRSEPSAFLNYAPQVNLASPGSASGSAFFEAGASESNRLWYSGVYATTSDGVARGLTSLTLDDQPRMQRLTFGDMNVATGALGGAAVVGGVTFSRDFSMDPYFIRFPSMRFTSTTDVPAHVDVYVNGVRVKSEAIDPGTFTLDNVRGVAGAGNVTYIVRNALGQEQSYSTPYYVGPSVFAKGVTDFAVSAGFPRENLGTTSFSYAAPVTMAYYQRGVTDSVTLGARAEGRWGLVSGGPYVATTAPFGMFSLEGGASAAFDGQAGLAGIFSYQYLSRGFSAGASLRALTDRYGTSTLDPSADRSLIQATTFTSVPIGHRATFATSLSIDAHRDLPASASVGFLSQVQLTKELTLVGQIALATLAPPSSTVNGYLTLAWTPANKVSVTAGVETSAGVPGANLQFTRTAGYGEDWSVVGAVNATAQGTEVSVEHRLQADANVVSTFLDWHADNATLSVQPAGSVIWVRGSGLFLARPVFDSFALVRVPKVADVRVYLNGQDVGRTNRVGNLLVPSLISFYGSELKIASEDVPLDYTLDRDVLVAAPPRRGAALVVFPAARAHFYRGRVRVVRKGVTSVPAYGDLAVRNGKGEVISPIGEDGAFELEGLAAGAHPAEVRHRTGLCEFTLEAKESDAPFIDLGVVTCRAR